ncbi:MAG: hypothetical protein KC593_02740 [Myxococcales bacterium]|nr:hypothetical protein [Myxococcales bacterium]MCB9630211.1 hypothetical protein [Sandaracinaceae bacterium]
MPTCAVDNGGCDPLVTCGVASGAIMCGACPTGYSGSGDTACTDVDECLTGTPCDALVTCTNTPGGFTCGDCPAGYSGGGVEGCVNIDECTEGTPCDALTVCMDTDGSFTCSDCPSGYVGSGVTGCMDVDECDADMCDPLVTCMNEPGTFTCGACPDGYTGDGLTGCLDIDECMMSPCDALTSCMNEPGTFTCGACPDGYTGDGLTGCLDIDECDTMTDLCVPTLATCTNTEGSHTCACVSGYTGDALAAGTGCVDIDECMEMTDDCVDANVTCTNDAGSYSCACVAGYEGDGTASGSGCRDVADLLHYRFDGMGTSVVNHASNPPAGTATATLVGGLTQGGTGQCGGGLIGDGASSSTSYLDTAWAPNLGAASWTISFYTSNIGASSTLFYILGDVNTGSLRCFTNGVAGADNWILRGAGLTDVYVNGGATVAPHMTTFVYDATANVVRGYLDGVLVTTVAQGTPSLSGTGPLKVGAYGANTGLPMGGVMDEFRLYSRALSDAEVATLYTTSGTCSP